MGLVSPIGSKIDFLGGLIFQSACDESLPAAYTISEPDSLGVNELNQGF